MRVHLVFSQWQVPVLLRYSLGVRWWAHPYLEVGAGLQVRGDFQTDALETTPLNMAYAPFTASLTRRSGESNRLGDVLMAGAGLVLGRGAHPVTLGLRYEYAGGFRPYIFGIRQKALTANASVGLLKF